MMDMSGQIIDQYRIETLLGSGPTGMLYRALDLEREAPVALKLLHARYVETRVIKQRMLDRFRAAIGISHPNIVEMLDTGEIDGRLYVVSEFVPDGSLRTLQQIGSREAFPLYMGIDLMRQAAEGLAFAHQNGVIHGSLKPENMLLQRVPDATGTGSEYLLKLSDFGMTPAATSLRGQTRNPSVGNPAYMSPEQVQGAEADETGDIYSLGIVLFEIATGQLPFDVQTPGDAVYLHVHTRPPSPRQSRPDIPQELSTIILRCLEKDPSSRFQTAGDLAVALGALIPDTASPAATVLTPPGQPVGDGVHLMVDRDHTDVVPGSPATLSITLDNRSGFPVRVMLTADGISPDWIRLPPGIVDLPPRSQVTGPVHVLVGRTPASTAGEHLLLLRAHIPGRTEAVSEARVRLTVQPFTAIQVRLDPPITSGRGRGSYQVTVENLGNERRRVVPMASNPPGDLEFIFDPPQIMLEPGRKIVSALTVRGKRWWLGAGRNPRQFSLFAASTGSDGEDRTPYIPATFVQTPYFPVWSLPVALVAVVLAGALLTMLPGGDDDNGQGDTAGVIGTATAEPDDDAAVVTDSETPEPATPDGSEADPPVLETFEPANPEPTAGEATPSPEPPVIEEVELLAFTSARNNGLNLYIMNPDGTEQTPLVTESGDDWAPAWSHDGTRIAWISKVNGFDEIFVAGTDGSNILRLTNRQVNDRFPVWAPDDSLIVFSSGDGNDTELYVVSPDGGTPVQLTDNTAFDGNPSWSPDGAQIAFVSNRTGSNEIFVMDADGSNVEQLTDSDGNNFNPVWSPDGERIAFVTDRDGDRDVYSMAADGTDETPLALESEDEFVPVWSPDGSLIAFVRESGNETGDLYIMDADGSNEELLAENVHAPDPNLVWSPDGTRIAFLRNVGGPLDIHLVGLEDGEVVRLTNNDSFDGNVTWRIVQIAR